MHLVLLKLHNSLVIPYENRLASSSDLQSLTGFSFPFTHEFDKAEEVVLVLFFQPMYVFKFLHKKLFVCTKRVRLKICRMKIAPTKVGQVRILEFVRTRNYG